jgi:cell division protein FtsI/penicillin-binding protein 2
MLRTVFDAHPNVSIPLESTVIILLYLKFRSVKNWNEVQLNKFYKSIFEQPKIDSWIINKDQLKKDILALGKDATFQRLIKLIYLNYTSFFNKDKILILGDKNPVYSYLIGYPKILLQLFPDAKIIHLTRDYRDHYLSMKKIDFEGNHLSLVCYRWRYSYKRIASLMKKLPEQYYFVRYEDIVTNPVKEITSICKYLNITFVDSMLKYYEIKDKVLATYPEEEVLKYHSSLFYPISPDYIGKWKQKLTIEEVRLADSIVGQAGLDAGYERVLKKDKLTYKVKVLPDIIYSQLWLFYKNFYDKLFPGKTNNKGGLMTKIYFKIFKP